MVLAELPEALLWAAPALVAVSLCAVYYCVSSSRSAAAAAAAAAAAREPLLDSALARARQLPHPKPVAVKNGIFEDFAFWEDNEALLRAAWREFGCGDAAVYAFPSSSLLHPLTAAAIEASDVDAMHAALTAVAPGVYQLPLLSDECCARLLAELQRLTESGIPARRPNGMNRYGLILSDLGFDGLLDALCARVARPLGERLYPEWVGADDCVDTYGFSVRYAAGGDLELAEHADTANLTLNVCLGVAPRDRRLEIALEIALTAGGPQSAPLPPVARLKAPRAPVFSTAQPQSCSPSAAPQSTGVPA